MKTLTGVPANRGMSPGMRTALKLLTDAYQFALDSREDIWEFAIELSQMRSARVSHSELRWLVHRGWVEHAWEIRRLGLKRRRFQQPTSLAFPEMTCFVLTGTGAEAMLSKALLVSGPSWDEQRRELRLDGQLVKRIARRAENQETILDAFQTRGWPARIDDPLPPRQRRRARVERLHEAVRRLNYGQTQVRLRFRRDGTGSGVVWEAA